MGGKIKIRSLRTADYTELKILLDHPMENGRNRDSITGQLIPAHFIQQLDISLNGNPIIQAKLGGSMAKQPFFTFRLLQSEPSDKVKVQWHDNLGLTGSEEHELQ